MGYSPTHAAAVDARRSPFAFEVLDGALVLFRLLQRIEGPEISSLPGLGILLSGVKSVLPRFQLSNHSRPRLQQSFEPPLGPEAPQVPKRAKIARYGTCCPNNRL